MSYNIFAEFYDALTANVDYQAYAEFLDRKMQEHKPGCKLIADLACGTGSVSCALAKKGYDVIGVDLSADMLSKAQEKDCPGVLWLCQDMRRLDLYGTIDAAVCVLDSVNHLTSPSSLLEAFKKVSLFLEPDGVFIFDANTPYKHERVLASNTFVYETDEVYCVWSNSPKKNGLTEISLDFFVREGELYDRYSESFCERAYSAEEIEKLLDRAGMKVVEAFDDYSEKAPGEKTERIVYIAKKKEYSRD